jgi:hypothetical protein
MSTVPVPATLRMLVFATSLSLVAAQSATAQDLGSILGQAKKALEQVTKPQQQKPNQGQPAQGDAVDKTSGLVGIIGLTLCAKDAKGAQADQKRGALCAVGALAAMELTRFLGNKISDGLKESEQREVLAAASKSLKTGEPAVVELPESGTTVSVASRGKATTKEVSFNLLADPALVKEIPKLAVVGEPRDVSKGSKVYAGPGEKWDSVGSLKSGETVHALGKADGSGWILVSRWMSSDPFAVPIATGYVSEKSLKATVKKDFPGEKDLIPKVGTAQTMSVSAVLTCKSMDFEKTDAQGNKVKDTSLLCTGPDGTPVSA